MPAHIVAYAYVMAMALAMFALLKRPLTASLMTAEDFDRRRNAWIGVTSAAFLAHNFWVFVFAVAVIVLLAAQRERNRPALFFLLLLTVPNFEVDVPGFGVVNFLFKISPSRLLSLLLLVPLAFRLVQSRHPSVGLQKANVGFVLAFGVLGAAVLAMTGNPNNTVANNVRNALDLLLLMIVPVYVMTHALRDLRELREALACIVIAFALLGLFALFETLRRWLVFEIVRGPLGLPPPPLTLYVLRELAGGGGALRAVTTAGHPIVLGYFMGVGLCLWVALRHALQPRLLGVVAVGAMAIGLLAALSRGPWVGAAAGLLALTLAGPNAGKRLVITSGVLVLGFLALMATPYGDKVLAYIPFVGTVERGTVDYRVKLVEVSMTIFWDHPILGDYDSFRDPRLEQMRQGQGIIDMVNTYLGVALQYGIVGVILFVAPFVATAIGAFVLARQVEREHPALGLTGRVLAGVMVATLVTIATTSSVEYMPIFYWPLLGCGCAYLGIAARWGEAQRRAGTRPAVARGVGAAMASPVATMARAATRKPEATPMDTAARTPTPNDPMADAPASRERARRPRRGAGMTGLPRAHRTYPDRT